MIFDSSVAVTGGLRCATRMARLLADVADVSLILPMNSQVPARELSAFNTVYRMSYDPLRRSLASALDYLPSLARARPELKRILEQERPHAFVLNDFFLPHGWLARRSGFAGKIVTWVRFDPARFPLPVRALWLKAAEQASDAVVAVSEFARARLPSRLNAQLIYDTLDLDLPVGRQPGLHRNVVCVGNFIRDKGQADVLQAFARISPQFPDVSLKFYGGDMGLRKNRAFRTEIEERARDLGLSNRVELHDFASDLRPVFADAAVAMNLSQSETFSLTCLEAQQSGIPVTAYRSGGPAEIVRDGETGYLCDVGDVEKAAERMSSLLGSEETATTFGMNAALHVAEKFNKPEYVRRVRAVLNV